MRNNWQIPLAFIQIISGKRIGSHPWALTKASSEIVGTTQSAVSQYVNSKRATRGGNGFAHMLPKIQETARQTADQLAKKQIAWREVTAKRRLKEILETTVQNIAAFVSGNPQNVVQPKSTRKLPLDC